MLKNGPVLFAEKGLESCYGRTIGCQPAAAPGYFSLRFKFHVDSDSVSDSSWNSISLRKSFNHSNCIKPADTAKKDIYLHYCALHSVWFLLRFGNAYAQEKLQKIVILYRVYSKPSCILRKNGSIIYKLQFRGLPMQVSTIFYGRQKSARF
jgi:hypothetical protein